MKKHRRQLGMAMVLSIIAIGAPEAAWAGDYDLLQSEAESRGQPLDEYLRALRSGEFETEPDAPPRRRAEGALRQVQLAAEVMLDGRAARAWGWAGRLTPDDLTNDFATFGPDGVRAFNVLDAEGFYERFKCNLFVFELAYRAGLRIPVMGRPVGWGYIGPSEVVRQIERNEFDHDWAVLVDDMELDELRESTQRGIPFVLVGEGRDGRAGHMGMIDELHVVERNEEGAIQRVVYTGWEANGDGAHYRRRTWGVWRFESIHIIELQEPESGQAQCFPVDRGPTSPSDLDVARAIVQAGAGADVIVRGGGIDLDGFEGGPTRETAAVMLALARPQRAVIEPLEPSKTRQISRVAQRSPTKWASDLLAARWAPRSGPRFSASDTGVLGLVRVLGLGHILDATILHWGSTPLRPPVRQLSPGAPLQLRTTERAAHDSDRGHAPLAQLDAMTERAWRTEKTPKLSHVPAPWQRKARSAAAWKLSPLRREGARWLAVRRVT